jgi:RNA polymerase sigma factor (sigma-70 family)
MPVNNVESNGIRPVSPEEVYANRGLIIDVAQGLGWDRDSAQDLVQEVAIKCWSRATLLYNPARGSLASFLAMVARSTAVDMWRNKMQYLPIPMEEVTLVALVDAEVSEKDEVEIREKRMRLLDHAVEELNRQYPSQKANEAFLMFSRQGKSGKEVAKMLGVEERYVNVAVHRGMERLKGIANRLRQEDNWRDAS